MTSATEDHFDRTEKKVFSAYNAQKEANLLVETELLTLRNKVIEIEQVGVGGS